MMNRLKNLFTSAKQKALLNAMPVAASAAVFVLLYTLGVKAPEGWVSYAIAAPALIVLIITALFRINDIREDKVSWLWQLRRVGLALVGTAAVSLLVAPLVHVQPFPTWRGILLYWGLAFTWITTPNHPPWWNYVNKIVKQ